MKSRDIYDIDETDYDLNENLLVIEIYVDDEPELDNSLCFTTDFVSKLGNYEYEYTLIDAKTNKERIETLRVINYPEAIKTGFKDVPDLGLLNYDGYGFNFKNATIKEILTELFIDNYEKFKKAYEEYAEIMGF